MLNGRYVYRCGQGHAFTLTPAWWRYSVSFTMIRLGFSGYTRCPVGNHRALVRLMDESDLTPEERQNLKLQERLGDQVGLKFNFSYELLIGVILLTITIATQSWLGVLASVLWIVLVVTVPIRVRRRTVRS
jgi:tetrahydromethanopterin S-methyltransferase subunit G